MKPGTIVLYEGGKGGKEEKGKGEEKGEGRGRREKRGNFEKKNVRNNVHCKHWQPQVAVLTVVCVAR